MSGEGFRVWGIARGQNRQPAEVYDEVLGRWLRLPHNLPHISRMGMSGSLLWTVSCVRSQSSSPHICDELNGYFLSCDEFDVCL